MKKYRLTKTWWDSEGNKYEPQDMDTKMGGYLLRNTKMHYLAISPEAFIEAGVDFIEEVKPERWVPTIGEDYYYINTNGDIRGATLMAFSLGNNQIGFRNYFKTLEQAQAVANKIKALLQEEQDKLFRK